MKTKYNYKGYQVEEVRCNAHLTDFFITKNGYIDRFLLHDEYLKDKKTILNNCIKDYESYAKRYHTTQ